MLMIMKDHHNSIKRLIVLIKPRKRAQLHYFLLPKNYFFLKRNQTNIQPVQLAKIKILIAILKMKSLIIYMRGQNRWSQIEWNSGKRK
jgi:hypothetical protein